MTFGGPEVLGPQHVTEDFDSGKPALDAWLVRRALANQQSGASRTWVVTDGQASVLAYYASATAAILRSEVPGRVGRNQPDDVPAILLARLAVDRRHQGRGLGAALMKHFVLKSMEVASVVGVRLLLVHAKDHEARSFYEHFGFQPSPIDEHTMMLLMQDIV